MPFEKTPLSDYYFLKRGSAITIDPWRDKGVYFGANSLHQRIRKRLENDFVQPRGVPKFFVHGSYGSGKTHTLAHVSYVLETEFDSMFPTEPVYLDIAPLTAKEKYERIHGRMIDAIGLDRIKASAEAVADANPAKDKVETFMSKVCSQGDHALKVSQANIFRNLLFGGRQAQLSWEWLKGRKVSVDDASTLSTQKSLTDPQDFVNSLLNIGALCSEGLKKKIVFLIDEAEAFRSVSNPDAQSELKHCLRLLLDNSNTFVGVILAIQVEGGQEDIGTFFTTDDIRRRVDFDQGYIDLNSLVNTVGDSRVFMMQLLSYLVDQDKAADAIQQEALTVGKDTFPFEEDAIKAISEHVAEHSDKALPAAIIAWMSNAAIEAWRNRTQSDKHQLVTREIVEQVLFPEEG